MTEIPPIVYHHKPPLDENSKMSITGASNLSASIKDKIAAAKARMANVTANTDMALTKLHSAADAADKINKSIEAEADQLLAEIGQFSNGGPD